MAFILDPADRTTQDTTRPGGPIPPALREFGRYPNVGDWLPGDIILFSECNPGIVGRTIRSVQTDCGYAPSDAQWQHAAIYVGQHHVCEAVWPRIRFHPIFERIGQQRIRVRRFKGDLTDQQRYELAINALVHVRGFYGWLELPRLLWQRGRRWKPRPELATRPPSMICSVLCVDTYARTLQVSLGPNQSLYAACPADLSLSDQLRDVATHWLQLT